MAIDPVDGFGSALGDSHVICEWRMQLGGGSSHILAISIGGADDRAGGLSRTPPDLIGTGWIAADAKAAVTPQGNGRQVEGAHIIARTVGEWRDRHGGGLALRRDREKRRDFVSPQCLPETSRHTTKAKAPASRR